MVDLSKLTTEQRNPLTLELDTFSALQIAQAMNAEDANAVKAVERVLPQVAQTIDWAPRALQPAGASFTWAPERADAWAYSMLSNARPPLASIAMLLWA
mgnify:CR=1 FL=1